MGVGSVPRRLSLVLAAAVAAGSGRVRRRPVRRGSPGARGARRVAGRWPAVPDPGRRPSPELAARRVSLGIASSESGPRTV